MRKLHTLGLLLFFSCAPLSLASAAEATQGSPSAASRPTGASDLQVQHATVPIHRSPATTEERARYLALQRSAPGAAQFQGGDTVVIGTTTAVVILAILLVIVLI